MKVSPLCFSARFVVSKAEIAVDSDIRDRLRDGLYHSRISAQGSGQRRDPAHCGAPFADNYGLRQDSACIRAAGLPRLTSALDGAGCRTHRKPPPRAHLISLIFWH